MNTVIDLRYASPHIAVLTLNNPPVNTLSWASREKLKLRLDELDENTDIRCVVVTGAGKAFTAGANLAEDQTMTEHQLGAFLADFERIVYGLERFRAPVIAAVNGPAIGGGLELALACDIRIAAREASFVAAGVNVGLIANFWRLARITGLGPAKEVLLTGDRYSAEQALVWGLVTEVCDGADLMDRALAKAERIATRAPLSVEATKACANMALDLTRKKADSRQVAEFQRLFRTEDHQEALRAFFAGTAGDYHRR